MPRYVVNEQIFLRPAQQLEGGEMEPDVIVEITDDRAGPLLVKGIISPVLEDVKILEDEDDSISYAARQKAGSSDDTAKMMLASSGTFSETKTKMTKTPAKKSGGQKKN